MPKMYLSNILTSSKDCQITQNINCHISQWHYKGNHIVLYLQDNKICAIVRDVFGKITMLSNENIKGGINGSINQDNLLKMIGHDCDKISITLNRNRNNKMTLWIIPKLEAAGITDEHIIQKAKECEEQAGNSANACKSNYSEDNFNNACQKYQEALSYYKRACAIKKQENEDTRKIDEHINVLKKEYCLFSLNKTMFSCLTLLKDRNEVEEIFSIFRNQKDFFESVLKSASINKNEEKNSPAENFTCAYVHESLGNYNAAAKHYLLLSMQQHNLGNSKPSDFCIEKAKGLFEKLEQQLGEKSFTTILENVQKEWPSKIISYIMSNHYFKILLEESRLKKKSYKFKEKMQKEIQGYNLNPDERGFLGVCEACKIAISSLNETCVHIKDSNRSAIQVENDIHELQREYFQFKLNSVINLYLPEPSNRSLLLTSIYYLIADKYFFVNKENSITNLLKSIEQIPEENQSLVDYFKCAYVCEFLEDPISASQYYFLLSKKYLRNENPELSVKCLEKAYNLIVEEAETKFDKIPIANFLEKLDIDFLNCLYSKTSYDNSCKSYLERILKEKKDIRKAFEKCSK